MTQSSNTALQSNIFDTALIFEGGGMRASYTSAVVNTLLEAGLFFDHVYGVSAGSSNTVNYLSRDTERTYRSFTEIVDDPLFGGKKFFFAHKGYFNAHYIYEEIGKPDGALPFDFGTFAQNPAKATIAAFERDTGKTRYYTEQDMPTLDALMKRVRASSTLPVVMPPLTIDGQVMYDGGLAEGNGILLPKAKEDGFKKFFIVRTRPKEYRKPAEPNKAALLFSWRRPLMRKALHEWGPGYNAICDAADKLMEEGSAYVVYAENMAVENSTLDKDALIRNYEAGWNQSQRQLPEWKSFLGV